MSGNEEAALGVVTRERPTRSKPAEDQKSTAPPKFTTEGLAEVLAFDVSAALREAREADAKRTPEDRERAGLAIDRAREEARRALDGLWTKALRGPISEPHAAAGWDSEIRVTVARSLGARLFRFGVPADLVALLLAGWAAVYAEPPLEEDDILAIVRGLVRRFAPDAQELAT